MGTSPGECELRAPACVTFQKAGGGGEGRNLYLRQPSSMAIFRPRDSLSLSLPLAPKPAGELRVAVCVQDGAGPSGTRQLSVPCLLLCVILQRPLLSPPRVDHLNYQQMRDRDFGHALLPSK